MTTPSLIELLENRIAPATFVNAFVVTYTDGDGDLVKVKSSKPIFDEDLRLFTFVPGGAGEELRELILKPSASGTDITIKVIEMAASGDGAANVGLVHASGVDLRSVTIEGALERIYVGDSDPTVRGIGLLHVGSLGLLTEGGPEESSYLVFGAGIVVIDGDLTGRIETPTPGVDESADRKPGNIDRLVVGGNLTGSVTAQGVVGKIKITGDLMGGEYSRSGTILATSIGQVIIEGSVIGASGDDSGTVEAPKGIGSVVVGGDIVGGEDWDSGGFLYGGSGNASFWLGGSLIGGSGAGSGFILAKQIDDLRIIGDVIGGSGYVSGLIRSDKTQDAGLFGAVQINGDVKGGSGYGSGWVAAEVRTSVVVGGSIVGGTGGRSGNVVVYTAFDFRGDIEVRIGGDLVGGTADGAGAVQTGGRYSTANVSVGGDIRGTLGTTEYGHTPAGSIIGDKLGKVKVDGSVIAAERPGAETHITSYAVRAYTSIAKLKIAGNIEGSSTNLLGISAGDRPVYGHSLKDGIGGMTVGGDLTFAEVSAGYSETLSGYPDDEFPFNPDVRIGKVRIDGDLTASSITAGIHPGADFIFGTEDDHTVGGEPTEIRSRIASIVIGGQVKGTAITGDAFAIAAQRVNSLTIGGMPVPLTSGLDTIQLAPSTGDVLFREHA